jgi:diaminopimelate epimerase
MKKIAFWKMSGSGNDFVVIDNRRHALRGNAAKWAKKLCHRQFGVGADGLLLLEPDKKEDFRMVYFNADGSRADMCGNGARCMAWFAHARGAVGNTFRFSTDAYPVGASVHGQVVRVSLADARDYRLIPTASLTPTLSLQGRGRAKLRVMDSIVFLNTGVPHAVVFVDNADQVDVSGLGRALRFHKAFGPKGTNVNFVQKIGPDKLRVRTYERGVEGETLACGTGVTASAIAAALKGIVKSPVRCVVAGGDQLEVNFKIHSESRQRPATHISLKGPVRLTFKGEYHHRYDRPNGDRLTDGHCNERKIGGKGV